MTLHRTPRRSASAFAGCCWLLRQCSLSIRDPSRVARPKLPTVGLVPLRGVNTPWRPPVPVVPFLPGWNGHVFGAPSEFERIQSGAGECQLLAQWTVVDRPPAHRPHGDCPRAGRGFANLGASVSPSESPGRFPIRRDERCRGAPTGDRCGSQSGRRDVLLSRLSGRGYHNLVH